MGEERFPFDTPSPWEQDIDKKLKWCEALESTGPENVRLIIRIKGWGDGRMFHDVRSRTRGPEQSGVRLNEGQRKDLWEWWPGVGDLRLMGMRETSHRSRAAPILTPLTFGRESFPPAR
jgi:hypothetical protein